ncbi:Alpha/Beta hydrolase protein [Collybia nuda]|uniref:Alpha/Beta hydrolase protein n=1 Tax=Collybia nuda TaxID=64659 RepID=A0A9P5YI03_9AGAR|nr:Alpha/Beta hydrolase protein [Collybia nuda]
MTQEYTLELPGGRTLSYARNGSPSSSTLVIFFHGVFGVGDAANPSAVLTAKKVHFVAPTLPGWGNSSPVPGTVPYHIGLAADMAALIKHLYPDDSNLKLYVGGGSYGTIPAQMLYGASFDIFPPGRYLAGCLVLAPFSPLRYHKGYSKTMTTSNYISIGPPSQIIPFRLLQRLIVVGIGGKLKTEEKAEKFIRETLFDNMEEEELAAFKKWRETQGRAEGEVERNMAKNVVKSVSKTWEGFMQVADVAHSDWGFRPDTLDDDHVKRPIFVVASAGDTLAPDDMARWLVATYKNAVLKSITGGHLASLFHLEEIWSEFLVDEV